MNRYLDFDLLIVKEGERYRARIIGSPAGEASHFFTLPFKEFEVENFLLRIGQNRASINVRRIDSPEVAAIKEFGGRLYAALFSGEVGACLRSSLYEASRQGAGLRIRLRLNDVPELADLPWEYLYNPSLNEFFSLSAETPLVRYLELPEIVRPLTVTPPLRILVMISSPIGYPRLNVEREWELLCESTGELQQKGLIKLERLDKATLRELRRRMREDDYHVFHFIGHGTFDPTSQDGALLLLDEQERGRLVSGQDLGTVLHDRHTLRLAVLNACEGARSSRTDPFAGTAQSLVQKGIPAVIAMQFEITDDAAITFAREFYGAVAEGLPVDAALAEARITIYADGNGLEWGTPVLYLRSPTGQIFNVEWKQVQIVALTMEAEEATSNEDWPTAIEKLLAILSLDKKNMKAAAALNYAQQQQHLLEQYNVGRAHYEDREWSEALEKFHTIFEIQNNYKDTASLIERTKREILVEQIRATRLEAQAAINTADWETAIEKLQSILRLVPSDTWAAENLVSARQEYELESLYLSGRELYEAGKWSEALNAFHEIKAVRDEYKDVGDLIVGSNNEIRRARIVKLYHDALMDIRVENWVTAIEKLKNIIDLEGDHPGARTKLLYAEEQQLLATAYAGGRELYDAGRLEEALRVFKEVGSKKSNYKDIPILVGKIKNELKKKRIEDERKLKEEEDRRLANQITDLYNEAATAMSAENWTLAIEKLEALQNIAPNLKDVPIKLDHAKRHQALASLYTEGQQNYKAKSWLKALDCFKQIHELDGNYKDVALLIEDVEPRIKDSGNSRFGRRTKALLVLAGTVFLLWITFQQLADPITEERTSTPTPTLTVTPTPTSTPTPSPTPTSSPILTPVVSLDARLAGTSWRVSVTGSDQHSTYIFYRGMKVRNEDARENGTWEEVGRNKIKIDFTQTIVYEEIVIEGDTMSGVGTNALGNHLYSLTGRKITP